MVKVITDYTLSECMEIMAEYAEVYEKQGRNIIFCEDRLTLIAERAITNKMGGTFFTSVNTFARFLKTEEKILSKQGSVMAIGSVMSELQRKDELKCFRLTSGTKNNAKYIYEAIAQLSSSRVSEEMLENVIVGLEQGILKDKLSDLLLIYKGYGEFLRKNSYIDESGYLALLPNCIRNDDRIKGSNVFFLCFNSFTSQAKEAIRAAIECGKNVIGIFCSGNEPIYTKSAEKKFIDVCFEATGKYPIVERKNRKLDGDAEILRTSLFSPANVKVAKNNPSDKIKVFEGADKTGEAEYVAVQIRKQIANNSDLRYRDFTVLVPSVNEYSLILKKVFDEYKIPYFIDEKKSLKQHPLSRFLLDALKVVRENYTATAVQSFCSNFFFGESDEYRNYLLKYCAGRGAAKKPIKTEILKYYDIEKLEEGRRKLLLISNIKSKGKGADYCKAVRKLLEDFSVKDKLEELDGMSDDPAERSYLSQISDALESLLCEAELLTGETLLSVSEFEAVLSDGLDVAEISVVPLKCDAVFVGDATDSRVEKANTLFVLGMTDALPRCGSDSALISDLEIDKISKADDGEFKAVIEPKIAEVNLRSRESFCLNLCSFLDKLYLTYSQIQGGEDTTLSDVFEYLNCARNKDGKVKIDKYYTQEEYPYLCSSESPAVKRLITEKKRYFDDSRVNREYKRLIKANYDTLYECLKEYGVDDLNKFADPDNEVKEGRIKDGEKLFVKNGVSVSATTLEDYFKCPFYSFASRGLEIKERDEAAVLSVDTGNYVHELLRICAKKFNGIFSVEEAEKTTNEVSEKLLQNPVYSVNKDSKSGEYALTKLHKEGVRIAMAVYEQLKGSNYQVAETEKNFNGKVVHGKYDRMDTSEKYVRIIDYKTGSISDKPSAIDYYTGRKLQLELYMNAVKGDKKPGGIFYFPASVNYQDEDGTPFKMVGYINGSKEAILTGDKNLAEGEESKYFGAVLDGKSKRGYVLEETAFEDFIEYSDLVAKDGTDEMKSGFIEPTPYVEACTYCKFGGMCGYDRERICERQEKSVNADKIVEVVRKHKQSKIEKDGND